MIAFNRKHPEDGLKRKYDVKAIRASMPAKFREALEQVERSAEGRKALARFRKFTGLPFPTDIRIIDMPGVGSRTKYLVGMGRAGKGGKIRTEDGKTTTAKGAKWVATDASGKRIYLLTGRNSKKTSKRLRKVGQVEETHYVPTAKQEKAGTFKKGKYWVHRHDDDGGRFPDVFVDDAGNYIYGRGTYSVTDWIRR